MRKHIKREHEQIGSLNNLSVMFEMRQTESVVECESILRENMNRIRVLII